MDYKSKYLVNDINNRNYKYSSINYNSTSDIFYKKYYKYKNKYLDLKNQIGGDKDFILRRRDKDIVKIPRFSDNYKKYRNEYDPDFFLDILESNNIVDPKIILRENENASWDYILSYIKEKQGPGAKHTSWDETLRYIKESCKKLLEKLNKNDAEEKSSIKKVVFIPLFNSATGGTSFSKSNFWFSLLYIKILKEEFGLIFDDVVLIGLENKNNFYLNNAKSNNIKLNIFTFDDGIYTGSQMKLILTKYINFCGKESINKIYVTVPFLIHKDTFFNPEWENWSDKKFDNYTKASNNLNDLTYKYREVFQKLILMKEANGSKVLRDNINKFKNDYEKYTTKTKFNFYKERNENNLYIYFRTLIEYSVGIDNFNENKNHWFQHKIPDKISFVQPYSGKILYNEFKTPYSKKWIINNIPYQNNLFLENDPNPNELFFNFNSENENKFMNQYSYSIVETQKCK